MYQSLKEYIRIKAGLQQRNQELKDLETRLASKLDYMASFINLTWPAKLELDQAVLQEALRRFATEFGEQEFQTSLHKNDLMFAFHLNRFPHDPAEALLSYYRVGYKTALNLRNIAEKYGLDQRRLLDFGSGYGRVSRFFPPLFPDSECVVSEVKEQAIDFQERALNLSGFTHAPTPEGFPAERFDLVLALSVFTHLPEELFRSWLQCLTERLKNNGAIIFTFLDQQREDSQEILKNFTANPKGIEYIKRSEDSYFTFVSDRLKDEAQYGSTFISRAWLTELTNSLDLQLEFLDYDLVPSQDAALVRVASE